jgi:hypothetical protein
MPAIKIYATSLLYYSPSINLLLTTYNIKENPSLITSSTITALITKQRGMLI